MTTETERFREARILITDDQESVVTLIERVVRDAFSCHIDTTNTGDKAISLLQATPYDVFVTDMKMPGLHGLELIAKALEACPDMHILVMTGYPGDFPYVEVIHHGAKDFLNKPFPPAELEAKLFRVLRERHLRHDLMVAHKKYRSLFDLSMDGKLLLNLDDLRIEDVNDAYCSVLGIDKKEIVGTCFPDALEATDRERFEMWLGICSRSGKGTMGDLQVKHTNDRCLHFDVTVTMVHADSEQFAFLDFKDITEKQEVDRRLADAAQKDALTSLYNKRSFTNRIEWAVASASEKAAPLALLLIDLDNFKRCNDTHGHQTGDTLLKSVGDVIKRSIRITVYDEGFRCGGDEFAVLLHNFAPSGFSVVAERMQSEFAKVERYGTTMSIGVAEFRAGMTSSTLIEAADKALYAAKAKGKDAICYAPSE